MKKFVASKTCHGFMTPETRLLFLQHCITHNPVGVREQMRDILGGSYPPKMFKNDLQVLYTDAERRHEQLRLDMKRLINLIYTNRR